MTFYGLSTYDRCKKLIEVFKDKGFKEISQDKLAVYIARYIGCSKFYNTVRNYMSYLVNFQMLTKLDNKMFKINYEVLDDDAD